MYFFPSLEAGLKHSYSNVRASQWLNNSDIDAVPVGNHLCQSPNEKETTTLEPSCNIVDQFLSIVEKNRDNCTPGTTFNLGDGVVAQYGLRKFRQQARAAVNHANLLTRLWRATATAKSSSPLIFSSSQSKVNISDPLESEWFLYSVVLSMVEADVDLFAAGNCYDLGEYKHYRLFCPFAYRLVAPASATSSTSEQLDNHTGTMVKENQILVKDLALEYDYVTKKSEFFYQARLKADSKLAKNYSSTKGLFTIHSHAT